eukprot:7460961-Pyramimonas_sp.AAC.1
MRAIGPCLPAGQGVAGEIAGRVAAARVARRQCGTFWISETPRQIKRLMFMAFVIGAALSGLAAFAVTTTHRNAIDSVLGRYLRTLACGAMSWVWEDGTTRCNKLRQVL